MTRLKFFKTSLEVRYDTTLATEIFFTQKTTKLFVVWVHRLMLVQFFCCIETLWTFTANIRLHSWMSHWVKL